jgi:LacI family transcriptional regulator
MTTVSEVTPFSWSAIDSGVMPENLLSGPTGRAPNRCQGGRLSATIRDVAERAGVSIKTVSRVINDEPFVREATRQRVLAAIDELGFVVNLSARRLAKGQSFAIGLIFHNASWHYILDVQRGVLETARKAGYSTILHPCDVSREEDTRAILGMVSQQVVDGLIFTPPSDNAAGLLQALAEQSFPFVRLTPSDRESPWPYVTTTDYQGAYDMTRYLLGLGHKRIAYVVGPLEQRAAHDRFEGYKAALTENEIEINSALIGYGDDHFATGFTVVQKILQANPRPTAVFCNNDEMAAGANAAVFEAGLRVPADVSVAGFDDVALSRQVWPSLTTIKQPIYEMAEVATNLLLSILNGEEANGSFREIPTGLIVRQSNASPSAVSRQ